MCNPFAYLTMNLLGENTKRDKNTLRRFQSKACVGFAIIKNRLNKFQMLKLFQSIPMSSAHALTMPACLLRRALSKLARNGSIALSNKIAEAGQPCITPDRNQINTKMLPLCS